jgi:hypothetical protein
MAEMKALNAKLAGYSKDPKDSLDLSGMNIGIEGMKVVGDFIPKW